MVDGYLLAGPPGGVHIPRLGALSSPSLQAKFADCPVGFRCEQRHQLGPQEIRQLLVDELKIAFANSGRQKPS